MHSATLSQLEVLNDRIVDKLRANDYKSHHLLFGIIQSVPFRFKAGIASSEAL